MHNNSITNCGELPANSGYRQFFIQEKNAPCGVSFAITNTTTVGDISAIVARALNCHKEISIQMSETRLPNELYIETFTDAAIKQITYSVTDIKPRSSSSMTTTSVVTPYFRWGVHRDTEGNEVLKFSSDNKVWNFNLNKPIPQKNSHLIQPSTTSSPITTQPMTAPESFSNIGSSTSLSPENVSVSFAKLSLKDSEKPALQTDLTRTELNKNEPTDHRFEKFFSSKLKLYKIEPSGGRSYVKEIGVAIKIDKPGVSIIIPRNSWAMYLVKGEMYYLLRSSNAEPTFGDVAVAIGSMFRVRVGKITKIDGNNDEKTLNVPLPEKFVGLFDKVVVQRTAIDQVLEFNTDNKVSNVNLNKPIPQNNSNLTQPSMPSTPITTLPMTAPESFSNSWSSTSLSPEKVSVSFDKLSLVDSEKPSLPTDLTRTELNKNEPTDNRLEKIIGNKRKLYKIEQSGRSYIKEIGVAMRPQEPVIIPRNWWAVYLVKGDTYHLVRYSNAEPSFGDVATTIGSLFHVRVGRISWGIGGNEDEKTINVPLPGSFAGLFDKVVLQRTAIDQIAL
jgi:hypothetical protein